MLPLLKVLILAFDKEDLFSIPIPYPAMYNPSKFSHTFTAVYEGQNGDGSSGENLAYRRTESGDVQMDFLFDATGASSNSINGEAAKVLGGVDAEILLFKEITLGVDKDLHRPRYLLLVWGTFIFPCQMLKMDIKYELFSPIGRPIRATVSCTFKEHKPPWLDSLSLDLLSPDLTKLHTVKAGETLPIIAENIYGDPGLYAEVARINGLTNFRKLKPGTQLVLPPIEK